MLTYSEFYARLCTVRAQIATACADCGRDPATVELLPVTKTHPAAAVAYAAQAGLRAVGENRVQEAMEKQASGTPAIQWELIGHLQSNKARLAAAHFDRVQSVDSLKLLQLLGRAAAELNRPLGILLQLNAGYDPAKFGADPAEADALLTAALAQPSLRIEGLMTIAPLGDTPAATADLAARTFDALRAIRDRLAASHGHPLAVLSMGMSGDLVPAIRAGSTQLRIGTALFGHRPTAEVSATTL